MDMIFVSKEMGTWGHLGIKYLSSILKEAGHNVEIVEAEYEKVEKRLKDKKFSVLGYSILERFAPHYLDLNRKLKDKFDILSIFGGIYPTAAPDDIIKQKGVDAVCIGEGEYAILELMDNLNCGIPIIEIKNLWVKQNGKIFKNSIRAPIDNLDSLPFPDRSLYYKDVKCGIDSVITSRGCVLSCSYCCYVYKYAVYQKRFRRRSVDNVIDELKQMKSMPKYKLLRIIRFEDSIFTISSEWLKEFSVKYRKEINIPFYCNVHANTITEEIVHYLKNAGCYSASLGIETANDYLRKSILNRDVSKKQIINAVGLLKNKGIKVRVTNLLGLPEGSLKSDLETLRLNIQCRPHYSIAYPLHFYQETPIFNFKKKDIPEETKNKNALSYRSEKTHQINRLQYLFSVWVEFSLPISLIRFFTQLPLGGFYKIIHVAWERYCIHFRLYPTGMKGFLRGLKRAANLSRLFHFLSKQDLHWQ